MRNIRSIFCCFIVLIFILAGCNEEKQIVETDINQQSSGSKQPSTTDKKEAENKTSNSAEQKVQNKEDQSKTKHQVKQEESASAQNQPNQNEAQNGTTTSSGDGIEVVAQPGEYSSIGK